MARMYANRYRLELQAMMEAEKDSTIRQALAVYSMARAQVRFLLERKQTLVEVPNTDDGPSNGIEVELERFETAIEKLRHEIEQAKETIIIIEEVNMITVMYHFLTI
ncbi:uncharacterized protein LOC144351307 [Saccoglossus kowalevskii]